MSYQGLKEEDDRRSISVQVMNWQYVLDMFHLGEQLFTVVHRGKHAHYLLGVGDKVRKSSRWRYSNLIQIICPQLYDFYMVSIKYSYPLLIILKQIYLTHRWEHITVYELLVLDENTWNHITVQNISIKNS